MATVRNLFCSPFIYRRQYIKTKKPAIRIVLIAAIVAVVLLIALAVAAGAENLSVAQYVMKLTHSEARSPDAIVTVNGKTMTTEALDNARKYSEASGTEFTDMNVYQVINNFVTQTIMLREAEKRGIVVENSEIEAYIAEQKELMRQYIADNPEIADSIAAYYREQGITADAYYETSDGNEQCRKAVMLKKLAEKLEDDYDKATASQEVKELKNATKLYYELYRKRYEKATILINQKNVDGYIETYHIKKSVT